MTIMALTEVNLLLDLYGKDAIDNMSSWMDENGIENLQKSLKKRVEQKATSSTLIVEMAHYGEYIDSGSKYTDKMPPPQAISAWCDRKTDGRKGNGIKDDPHEFNSLTYPVSWKIYVDGIKPKPFLHIFTDLMDYYEELFGKALKKDVLKSLENL